MEKFRPESQYMRKGVMALFAVAIPLAIFFCWYWVSYIFRVSNEAFYESVPGGIPWWMPTLAMFIASYIISIARKIQIRDARKNKYISYDGKDSRFHSCLLK
ncbi:MAG TPA: hypothetical protein DIT56_00970 [Candidatus Moranbacteria bacterium]|nr:hypothetical protein [Candidatus Moranbacteria bacterium]